MGKIKSISNLDALKIVSKGIKDMTTVNHLEEVRYFPTIITSYNRATGIGGHPLRRLSSMHGKESTGKSVLALAIAESARIYGHVSTVFEAEFSAEHDWMNNLIVGEGTLLKMPSDLDELFGDIQTMLNNLAKAKKSNDKSKWLSEDIGCCLIVDTLTKLIPKEQFETILEEGISRGYSQQALWVSIWTKIIVPQIYRSNSSLLVVLQERINVGATKFQKKRKVTLGEALLYDSSIRIECTHSKAIKKDGDVVALQFFYKVEKNKVDGWSEQVGSFFTSTGKGDMPSGFDRVREAIEESMYRGILKSKKKKKVDYMVAEIDGEVLFEIEGGREDVRIWLRDNPNELKSLVDLLNRLSRRKSENRN